MAAQPQQISVKQGDTFSSYLKVNMELIKRQIQIALPKHMNADRMIRILMTELRRNPALNHCSIQSVLGSIMQASQLGLEIGSLLGHGYLVPFGKECQFIIGYRGMIELALRSGKILAIGAWDVHENDYFKFQYGIEEKLKHIPTSGERGKFIASYAVAKLDKGAFSFGVMFKNEIDKIRAQSKSGSKGYSPWSTHYDEMAKKTVLRRLFKYLPISIEIYEKVVKEELEEVSDIPLVSNEEYSPIEGLDDFPSPEKKQSKADLLSNKMNNSTEINNETIAKEKAEEMAKEYFNEK